MVALAVAGAYGAFHTRIRAKLDQSIGSVGDPQTDTDAKPVSILDDDDSALTALMVVMAVSSLRHHKSVATTSSVEQDDISQPQLSSLAEVHS